MLPQQPFVESRLSRQTIPSTSARCPISLGLCVLSDQHLTSSPDLQGKDKNNPPESCMAEREPARRNVIAPLSAGPSSASNSTSDSRPDQYVLVSRKSTRCVARLFLRNNFMSCSYRKLSTSPQLPALPLTPLQREDGMFISTPPSATQQPPNSLAQHNIKVRDFAYESVLPPIPSIPRFRPLQAGPRPLKRHKRSHEPDTDDDPFLGGEARPYTSFELVGVGGIPGDRQTNPQKARNLEHKLTEPIVNPEQPQNTLARATAYVDLSRHISISPPGGVSNPSTPPTYRRSAVPFNLSPIPGLLYQGQSEVIGSHDDSTSSQPLLVGDSQESETQVDTPLATPNGSLHFPNTDRIMVATSQSQTDSQLFQEDVTYSQLGLSLPFSQPDFSQTDSPEVVHSAASHTNGHLSSPSRISRSNTPLSSSPSPCKNAATLLLGAIPVVNPSSPSQSTSAPYDNATSPARYFLRKRPAPSHQGPLSSKSSQSSSSASNAKPTRNSIPSHRRPASVSRQSAHSRSPKKLTKDSLRAKPIKKNAALKTAEVTRKA